MVSSLFATNFNPLIVVQIKDETDDERRMRLEMEALAADEADRRKQVGTIFTRHGDMVLTGEVILSERFETP